MRGRRSVRDEAVERAVGIVARCWRQGGEGGGVTRRRILGRDRSADVVEARCALVQVLVAMGFGTAAIARALRRTQPAVRHMMARSSTLRRSSRAYRAAEGDALAMSGESL